MRRGLAVLDFVWHLRGFVKLRVDRSDEAVLEGLQGMLEGQGKKTERGQSSLIFEEPTGASAWTSNWLALAIYTKGQFWIDRGLDGRILRYDLDCFTGFVFCLVAAVLAFAIASLGGDFRQGLRFGTIAFGWLYGMNIALALIRVPALIRRSGRGD